MINNIFNLKRDESGMRTNDPIEKKLPHLYKAHDKLIQKADPYNHELSSSLEELANFLGYKAHEVRNILKDLSKLNLISIERNKEKDQYKIKLLVN